VRHSWRPALGAIVRLAQPHAKRWRWSRCRPSPPAFGWIRCHFDHVGLGVRHAGRHPSRHERELYRQTGEAKLGAVGAEAPGQVLRVAVTAGGLGE
jgi:hypothetical protein